MVWCFRRQAYRFQLLIETRSVCSFAFHDSTLEGLVCVSVALFCGQRHPQPQDLHLLGSKMHQRSTAEHISKNQICLLIRLPKLRCACRYFMLFCCSWSCRAVVVLLFLVVLAPAARPFKTIIPRRAPPCPSRGRRILFLRTWSRTNI